MDYKEKVIALLNSEELSKEQKEKLEAIFPQLKESEDEKTKRMLHTIANKMSQHLCDIFTEEEFQCFDTWSNAWLEKQNKQNFDYEHADIPQKDFALIEPKFKVRDWLQYRNAEPFLVEEITEQGYCNGNSCLPFEWEDEIHLWDIQDAEDGDVLVDVYGNIGIFKKCYDFDWMSYCSLGNNGGFQVFTVEHENEKTYPATKEQCKLLFQKMKEDGWEWDAEKKELKTIEQKSTDNIGSKFKVEDYIVPNNDAFLEIWRIINIDKDGYYNIQCITNSEYDEIYRIPAFVLEKEYHLWTIADAKCGDVLVASDGSLFILSKVVDTAAFHYFSLCKNGSKEIGDGNHAWESVRGCHPATKEERELLYAKMKESGWEWDSEKKELKKTYRTI